MKKSIKIAFLRILRIFILEIIHDVSLHPTAVLLFYWGAVLCLLGVCGESECCNYLLVYNLILAYEQ